MRKSAAKAAALDEALVSESVSPVTERIAIALDSDQLIPSSTWEALLAEASSKLTDLAGKEQRARQAAGDLSIPAASARFARDEADDLLHEARRIQAAIDKVNEILPHVREMERRDALMPVYLAYKLERAKFALRLAERWPALAAEMVELLEGIRHFDQPPPCEVPEGEDPLQTSVEAIARGCSPNFFDAPPGQPLQAVNRLGTARIPSFGIHGPDRAMLWTEYNR